MARTRQKSKQRKAKRLEQEQRVSGRSPAKDAAAAVDEAIPEPSPVAPVEDGGVAEKADPAAEQVAPARSPGRAAAADTAPARTAKDPDQARQRPARSDRGRQKAADRRQPRRRNRVVSFFIHVWAELRRVQWPTRNQVTQATAVVVVFCFLAGLYLAMWDFGFNRLVKALL